MQLEKGCFGAFGGSFLSKAFLLGNVFRMTDSDTEGPQWHEAVVLTQDTTQAHESYKA